MSSTWFYGDNRHGENPLEFLTNFEAALTRLPHLSESAKCKRFYNHCKSDFDAEDWYENLEKNSPAAVALWSNLILHFRVKWLGASPNTLLEIRKPVTTTELDTATTIAYETTTTTITNANTATTTTTTIPAPTSTAALAVYKTTTTPERPDRVADTRCIIALLTPTPTKPELETPTSTTATNSDNAIATVKHQDDEKRVAEREEGGEEVKKWEEMSEREVERREADTGEQERAAVTQGEVRDPAQSPTTRAAANARPHEPARSDWVAEVDEAMGLSPVTLHPEPADPAPAPINPVLRTWT
jgi:hypothetical protein